MSTTLISTATVNLEEWYKSIVKPSSFYRQQANIGDGKEKNYFYNIDLRGRVFLEDTLPKNDATSLKDPTFLRILFQQMRRINANEYDYLSSLPFPYSYSNPISVIDEKNHPNNCALEYPFVSPCGKERNFIRPVDLPIVFSTIQSTTTNTNTNTNIHMKHSEPFTKSNDQHKEEISMSRNESESESEQELVFGPGFSQPFLPNALRISIITGRLYHPLMSSSSSSHSNSHSHSHSRHLKKSMYENNEYGLISSSLAIALSNHFVVSEEQEEIDEHQVQTKKDFSGIIFCHEENNIVYPIPWLPLEAESGTWSFKGQDD